MSPLVTSFDGFRIFLSTHLADVEEPFQPGLQLDEDAVLHYAHRLPLHAGADGVFLVDVEPRVSL